jgi:uncharacterized protein (TIGR02266 family)
MFLQNSATQRWIAMHIAILFFLGFLLFFVGYYLWKVRNRSEIDYRPSVQLPLKAGKEGREHPRTDVHWAVTMETPEGAVAGEINNISLGGAFICCKKPLPVGEVFGLTLICPENESVIATAKVVWSNVNVPDEKVVHRGMGIRFIKMSDRHIQLIRQVSQ